VTPGKRKTRWRQALFLPRPVLRERAGVRGMLSRPQQKTLTLSLFWACQAIDFGGCTVLYSNTRPGVEPRHDGPDAVASSTALRPALANRCFHVARRAVWSSPWPTAPGSSNLFPWMYPGRCRPGPSNRLHGRFYRAVEPTAPRDSRWRSESGAKGYQLKVACGLKPDCLANALLPPAIPAFGMPPHAGSSALGLAADFSSY